MPYVTVGTENSADIDIYYEDRGAGRPVVLIHGYPLDGHSWELQVPALLATGHRVIAYDRRGFGKSSAPSQGYDYDTFADDLHAMLTALELRGATLAGFSMGTGEVARYLHRHGAQRVAAAVFIASLQPHLLHGEDNPDGLPASLFEGLQAAATADRYKYFSTFFELCFNTDEYLGKRISEEALHAHLTVAASASAIGTVAAIRTWTTDFRADVAALAGLGLPTLIVHGTSDRVLPIEATGRRLHQLLPRAQYVEILGAPHGLLWTHAEQLTAELTGFLAKVGG